MTSRLLPARLIFWDHSLEIQRRPEHLLILGFSWVWRPCWSHKAPTPVVTRELPASRSDVSGPEGHLNQVFLFYLHWAKPQNCDSILAFSKRNFLYLHFFLISWNLNSWLFSEIFRFKWRNRKYVEWGGSLGCKTPKYHFYLFSFWHKINEYLTVSVSSGTASSWTAFFKFMFNKTRYYYLFILQLTLLVG